MAKNSNRSSRKDDWGVAEMARERPLTTAAVAAGAAAAGLFLWSRRAQISDQLSNLSDQLGEWTEGMRSGDSSGEWMDDETSSAGTPTSSARGTTRRRRGMSETGGGNANLGARSGGGGTTSTASGRGQAQNAPTS